MDWTQRSTTCVQLTTLLTTLLVPRFPFSRFQSPRRKHISPVKRESITRAARSITFKTLPGCAPPNLSDASQLVPDASCRRHSFGTRTCHTTNQDFYGSFFYINICGFIGRGKFLYETRVLDSSYLRYKVQLPTSDSTEIIASGIKIRLEGPVPLDAP